MIGTNTIVSSFAFTIFNQAPTVQHLFLLCLVSYWFLVYQIGLAGFYYYDGFRVLKSQSTSSGFALFFLWHIVLYSSVFNLIIKKLFLFLFYLFFQFFHPPSQFHFFRTNLQWSCNCLYVKMFYEFNYSRYKGSCSYNSVFGII